MLSHIAQLNGLSGLYLCDLLRSRATLVLL